jgi:hypothetical protein
MLLIGSVAPDRVASEPRHLPTSDGVLASAQYRHRQSFVVHIGQLSRRPPA